MNRHLSSIDNMKYYVVFQFFKNWYYHLCYTKDHDVRIKLIGWRYVADLSKYFHQDNYFHCSIEILNNDWSSNFPSLNKSGFNSWIFNTAQWSPCSDWGSVLNFNLRWWAVIVGLDYRGEYLITWYIGWNICIKLIAFQLQLQRRLVRQSSSWLVVFNIIH